MAKYGPKQQVLVDHRVIWGSNPPEKWTDNKPTNYHGYEVVEMSDEELAQARANANVSPVTGNLYTGAWRFFALIEWQSYVRDDEDPTDHNVYIETKIKPISHHVWSSRHASTQTGGFNDIGAIYLNHSLSFPGGVETTELDIPDMGTDGQGNPKRNALKTWQKWDSEGVDFCEGSMDHARKQLESCIVESYSNWNTNYDTAFGNARWLVGCILDNGTSIAWCLLPGGAYYELLQDNAEIEGSQLSGQYWEISDVFTFPPDAFTLEGKFKPEWAQLPYYAAGRSLHGNEDDGWNVLLSLQSLFNFNLDDPGSLFNYIPWAVLDNGNWLTCDRPSRDSSVYDGNPYNDGLQVRKGSRWENHYIWNNSMYPTPDGESDGFRVQNDNWVTSPKTP